jgi:hypothetical protein
VGADDPADQERGHVEPLPGLEVVTDQHRDLGVEPDGPAIVGVCHSGSVHRLVPAGLVRS